jgi:S-formylglutathione hydrolase FrmB
VRQVNPTDGVRVPGGPLTRKVRTVGVVLLAAAVLGAIIVHNVLAVDTRGADVRHITIKSRFAHRSLRVTLVQPAGATQDRPLLVFLHGRGDKGEDSNVNDEFFKALSALGDRAPAVVFPNGGNHGYWHDRHGAKWARYVLDEVIPRAAKELRTDPKRVAIGGISMGGFGALDLARLHPHRFCAVGAHSPALWQSGGETAPGAFDDAQDFARHDVIAAARRDPGLFSGTPVWLDAGSADPFRPGDRAFDAASSRVRLRTYPGAHEGAYWRAHYRAYLRFYANALARC